MEGTSFTDSLEKELFDLCVPSVIISIEIGHKYPEDVISEMISLLGKEYCVYHGTNDLVLEFDFPDEKMNEYANQHIFEKLEGQVNQCLNSENFSNYTKEDQISLNICRLFTKFRLHFIIYGETKQVEERIDFYIVNSSHTGSDDELIDDGTTPLPVSILVNSLLYYTIPKIENYNIILNDLYSKLEMEEIRKYMEENNWKFLRRYLDIKENIIVRHVSSLCKPSVSDLVSSCKATFISRNPKRQFETCKSR